MLVLTRRLGESIWINDDIRIVIQNIRGNQVRVGIAAPREMVVHREEIYQKIHQENRAAQSLDQDVKSVESVFTQLKANGIPAQVLRNPIKREKHENRIKTLWYDRDQG